MSVLDGYLEQTKKLVVDATSTVSKEKSKKFRQMLTLLFLVKLDVPKLIKIVTILKEQRDGYRKNYWAAMNIHPEDQRETTEDNDTEINEIIGQDLKALR